MRNISHVCFICLILNVVQRVGYNKFERKKRNRIKPLVWCAAHNYPLEVICEPFSFLGEPLRISNNNLEINNNLL